ncbi:MAG: amidohydrolase family protein [Acidimicrobiales bacterium]|nr:amidohydrolase [Acidimicrobiales bacterium]
MRFYSCDSHVVEGAEVFEGLAEHFGELAPHIVDVPEKGLMLTVNGQPRVSVGRFGIAGHKLDDPETEALIAAGYEGLNPGVVDSTKRLAEQEQDGIAGEVMYPSLSMFTFAVTDDDIRAAAFRQHNDWILDYCAPNRDRLIGIGCLPVPDVEASVAEAKRAGSLGVRGFSIPSHAPLDKPYSDPMYDPLWAVLEEMNLPVTMHIFTGSSFDCGLPAHFGTPGGTTKGYTMAHITVVNSIMDLIMSGVVERFAGLRFISAEFETGWVAHWKQRFDHAAYRTPWELSDDLTMKPSEYFDRNFYVTFEDDAQGVATRHEIGIGNLLWGNDYPHHDSIWPNSMSVLEDIFAGVPEDEVEQMVWGNVIDLYGIDVANL